MDNLEKTIIGELFLDMKNQYLSMLESKHFGDDINRRLFTDLLLKRKDIRNDIVSAKKAMEVDVFPEIDKHFERLTECMTSAVNVCLLLGHIKLLRDARARQEILLITSNCEDAISENNLTRIHELSRPMNVKPLQVQSLKELSLGYGKELEERKKIFENGVPYPTGFQRLDYCTGGILTENITVVGGRTSFGKSALMMNIAVNIAMKNVPVFYLSFEMSANALFDRIVAARTEIESHKLRHARVTPSEMVDIQQSLGRNDFYEKPLHICYSPYAKMSNIYEMVEAYNPKIIFVDHIQIMRVIGNSRAQAIEDAMYELRNIAGEYEIGVVVGSQINRESIKGGSNDMQPAYFKGSGGIEDAATTTYEIKLDGKQEKTESIWNMVLELGKNRFGMVGKIPMQFERPYLRFKEISDHEQSI